jgi:hypothetical protein
LLLRIYMRVGFKEKDARYLEKREVV